MGIHCDSYGSTPIAHCAQSILSNSILERDDSSLARHRIYQFDALNKFSRHERVQERIFFSTDLMSLILMQIS
jgi:hypothetical protein